MFISEMLVHKFQDVYVQKYGQHIAREEAEQLLSNLAELIRLLSTQKERS